MAVTTILPSYPDAMLVPRGRYADLPPVKIGRPLTLLGSSDHVHVRLQSRTISPTHAMILNVDGKVIIRDLASQTQLLVNKQVVREAVLEPGDKIRIGRIRFRFHPGDPAPDDPQAESPPQACLWNEDGQAIAITEPIFMAGASPEADLPIPGSSTPASVIIFTIGQYRFIRRLNPDGGLCINDSPAHQSLLLAGDVIDLDGSRLQFDLAPAETAEECAKSNEYARRDEAPAEELTLEPAIVPEPARDEEPIDALAMALPQTPAPSELREENLGAAILIPAALGMPVAIDRRALTDSSCLESADFEESDSSTEVEHLAVADIGSIEQESTSPDPLDESVTLDHDVAAVPIPPATEQEDAESSAATLFGADVAPLQTSIAVDSPADIERWGPLAMAMVSRTQSKPSPHKALSSKDISPPIPLLWGWVSLAAAIVIMTGVGAWLRFRGAL